ncbi:uncharacterized protein MONBRDRAFT_5881 [Monosiga brevicollis MX1]|uniref:DNA polymerase delta subunit 4 n=1 Tax=Monosiga brevicollis TaxID=81824 RepID=A9USR8_MONBE|nr:uncharacterized protein MONBRDRAFT_5881 [Monosiga brevicollis MX1]EDQ91825.1 predicted protein [Monosiga brevicollis MX1]|eukprot:XP_001743111.1 hypothetical protein [Monosiga brevicollis MX1]
MSLYQHFEARPKVAERDIPKYKQKRTSSSSSIKVQDVPAAPATVVAGRESPATLAGHHQYLRQFDLDMTFGPCVGVSRRERWERADAFGLNPPKAVLRLLENHPQDETFQQCLWYNTL